MIISIEYQCDWPDCKETLICRPDNFSDYNWEGRDYIFSNTGASSFKLVCPKHRFHTTRELLEAIEEQWKLKSNA